jgi:hypothetical protein
MATKKLYAGCYRIEGALRWTAYGHIRKIGSFWQADIHNAATGDILRPAGLWATLRDAEDECRHLLNRDYGLAS